MYLKCIHYRHKLFKKFLKQLELKILILLMLKFSKEKYFIIFVCQKKNIL